MASFLNGFEKVLEIGTGDGRGTLALLNVQHTVVRIDENPEILAFAQSRLIKAGKTATYQEREIVQSGRAGYSITYQKPKGHPSKGEALLLDGDINNDDSLMKWLRETGPFDAVICWMIGTHNARKDNALIQQEEISTTGQYRLFVQNQVYRVADQILRSGGLLQIVDRGQPPKTSIIREDLLAAHREQAQSTSLVTDSLEYRIYEEATGDARVNMQVTPGLLGITANIQELALVSIISEKPE